MTPATFVVPLADALDVSLVGGKAANLARMIRAGLPVPDGFVVTTSAFRAAAGAEMPAALAEEIRRAYERLGSPLVAARSSATAEDMAQASMAGQYETFLNLGTAADLLAAVGKCWHSLRSNRVTAYLAQHGIAPASVAMAVVVQRLVPASAAGVLFTANPRTGATDEMLIDAAWGLGEAVVSGAVQPDVVRVSADDGNVVEYQVADKKTFLAPGSRNWEPVPSPQRTRACLDYATIRELWRLGHAAVRHFHGPQDLEWAVADGRVSLLQSRPVTTLEEARANRSLVEETRQHLRAELARKRGPWVSHNLGETLPHPTPLTWAVVRPYMSGSGGFGRMYRNLGFNPAPAVGQEGFLELIGGGVYMDCARMPEMFSPGYPYAYDVLLLRANPDAAQQPPTLPRGSYRELAAAARLGTAVTAKLHALARDLDTRFDDDFVPELEAWCATQAALPLAKQSDTELIELWRARQAKVMDEFGAMAFLPSMVEALVAAELRAFLDEHVWDRDPDELLHALSSGIRPDRTMAANIELQEFAQGHRPLAKWLGAHGHRAPNEFELATPRWYERPDDLRRVAAPLTASPSLAGGHRQRREQADATLATLRAALPADRHGELEQRVQLVRRYVRFREDGKYHWMRAYALLRSTALEFGRRLGLGERVFFLTPDEIAQALTGGFVPEDRIARRTLRHRAEARLRLPRVIERADVEALGRPAASAAADSQWKAHPVSGGVNSGPARIVLQPDQAGDLGSGYVLVCPSTDPSWTPLFAGAAGLILERGGTLSHGAVVAREMGVPAIVLDGATTMFADGERLLVDGNCGQVSRVGTTDAPPATAATPGAADDPVIPRNLIPPGPGAREQAANQWSLVAAALWGLVLGALFLLPDAWLRQPAFAALDACLWPLVPRVGMVGMVTLVGAVFGVVLIAAQYWITDNRRLWEAKQRATGLRKLAGTLPADSPRRATAERLVAPMTLRMLKAALVPLNFLLGPMILVFLWLPERADPAAWASDPGGLVTVVARVAGDFAKPVTLEVPAPLQLESASAQSVPPIRRELEQLREEWPPAGEAGTLPRELLMLADHTRLALLASLDTYLKAGVPPQPLSWLIRVPDTAQGHFPVRLLIPGEPVQELVLAFGRSRPPAPAEITAATGAVQSFRAVYPRPLKKRVFWVPLAVVHGPAWDVGWLTVYVFGYLAAMLGAKAALRVP